MAGVPIEDTLSDFEVLPTVETELPLHAGHRLAKRLGSHDGYELHLGDKPYFGVSRRAVIKTAPRRSPGYLLKRRRLVEEGRILGALRHPNLIALLEATEDERGTHLVFEHLEGVSLERATALLRGRNEALPFELCVFIVTEVLRGMSCAHVLRDDDGSPLRLVLREIVPGNVLVARTGHVKLATFAFPLAPHGDAPRPHPHAPAYLAPERIARRRYDARADVYSAGMLLFELLFGRPRGAGQKASAAGELEQEGAPGALVEVVSRATEPRPEDRYQSASAMARDLLRWLQDAEHHTAPATVAKFFERQGLFDRGAVRPSSRKAVPLSAVLEEDATVKTIEPIEVEPAKEEPAKEEPAKEEPPNETLSAVIIFEELEPPPPAPPRPEEPLSLVVLPAPSSIEAPPDRRVRMIGTVLSLIAFALAIAAAILTAA
jgi:serine/threonine protein kinase